MPRGIVKWFNENKGTGVIRSETGEELPVHFADLVGEGFKTLDEGETVEFEKAEGEKGPRAVKVSVLKTKTIND